MHTGRKRLEKANCAVLTYTRVGTRRLNSRCRPTVIMTWAVTLLLLTTAILGKRRRRRKRCRSAVTRRHHDVGHGAEMPSYR